MWWNHDPGWGGWLMMTIAMGSFWILLAVLVYALLRNGRPESTRSPGAREILQERFARGEIDAEEYQTRLDILTRTSR